MQCRHSGNGEELYLQCHHLSGASRSMGSSLCSIGHAPCFLPSYLCSLSMAPLSPWVVCVHARAHSLSHTHTAGWLAGWLCPAAWTWLSWRTWSPGPLLTALSWYGCWNTIRRGVSSTALETTLFNLGNETCVAGWAVHWKNSCSFPDTCFQI